MKFGVYSDTGNTTCEGYPGSWGHEQIDAADYASWGVDYLKFDYCGMDAAKAPPRHYYERMRDALNATGRPIVFSICNWGTGAPHRWGQHVGHSWRTGRDLFSVWDEHTARKILKLPGFLQSVSTAIEQQAGPDFVAGSGCDAEGRCGYNDPDMLLVGLEGMTPYGIVDDCPNHLPKGACVRGQYVSRELWGTVGGLTFTEQRTHFAFWCMLSAPLMLGNDPRTMRRRDLRLLSSPELLAISQDPGAKQARRVSQGVARKAGGTPIWWESKDSDVQIWMKDLSDGTTAFLLFNAGERPTDITVHWKDLLPAKSSPWEVEEPRMPPCSNRADVTNCEGWAKSGECDRNPGFMRGACALACGACPPLKYVGMQATALVRDAWEEEFIGLFTSSFTALLVEPHGCVVITVRFGPKEDLRRRIEEDRRSSASRAPRVDEPGFRSVHGDGPRVDESRASTGLSTREEARPLPRGGGRALPTYDEPALLRSARNGDDESSLLLQHVPLILATPIAALCGFFLGRRTRSISSLDRRAKRGGGGRFEL